MAQILHKDVGDLWSEPTATFTIAGTPTDPTNLTVRLQDAAGVESVLLNNVLVSTLNSSSTPVKKTSVGVFQPNPGPSLTAQGYWIMRFEGAGAVVATEEWEVIVDPSEFTSNAGLNARALVGLREAKDWLQSQTVNTSNDLDLVRVINDISDRMYEESEREFKSFDGGGSAVRIFDPNGYWPVRIGDLSTTPTLVRILDKDGNSLATVAAGDQILRPRVRRPWQPITSLQFTQDVIEPRWSDQIEVTGVWGFPAVPGNVRQAVLEAVAAVMDRDVEHYSQDLGPASSGQATNVIMLAGARPSLITMPPSSLAVARSYQPSRVG